MLLLSGPPSAGANARFLEEVRAAVARGATDFRLLVPTATLAEHLRHALVREGQLVRPGLIQTLAHFLAPFTEGCAEAPAAALELLLAEELDRVAPESFRPVARLEGFRAQLARRISEVASTGCGSRRLAEALRQCGVEAPLASAFIGVYRAVEEELERRGWVLRAGLLERAARRITECGLAGVGRVILDGFFSFSAPELGLLRALGQHADVTVALPNWKGAESARAALLEMGFQERHMAPLPSTTRKVLVAAANVEQEAEEIARRILEQVEAGRPFREIGVVLRTPEPYAPVLRTVFERFGIPARFYFAPPLAEHAVVRYFGGIVGALLGGWDHADTLAALRMTPSPGAGADEFDFKVRERLPGKGLAGLRELVANRPLRALLDRLVPLEQWRALRLRAPEWAAPLKMLVALTEPPSITDGCSHEKAALWRAQAAALAAFASAMDATAQALADVDAIALSEFWSAADLVRHDTPLRTPDRRRNVVHVLDVFEARQWALPVVFLPGLLERQFPLYHSPDPFFPDSVRECLRGAGLRLDTTEDLRRQERFLFELAATRATSELVLSYPESNAKGDPNLPSFFLDGFTQAAVRARAVRPALPGEGWRGAAPVVVRSPELLAQIGARHAELQPTAIEDFLQCPFQFFGRHTLRLTEPPVRPEERLDALVKGNIVHRVLAEWQQTGRPVETVFEEVFARTCARERVPLGHRTELARLRMLEDLQRFAADPPRLEGWSVHLERDIDFGLGEETRIRGRIDRHDVSPDRAAVVFDFKYSSAPSIRKRIRGYDEGRSVQGALYLLGLEAQRGYRPAGWFYWGLRRELYGNGWHALGTAREYPGTACTPEELRERLEKVRTVTLEAARQIREGRIEADPADPDRCEYCPFRDVCRIRAAEKAVAAGGAA